MNGAGMIPPYRGAQRFEAAGRFEPGAPCAGLRAYEEAAVRRMRNKDKIKSISADSGVGSKGVKADPRRAAKAARTYQPTGRRPAASGQADRGQRGRRSKRLCPLWWYQRRRDIYGPRGPVTCCSHPFSDSSRYRYPAAGGG